MQIVVLASPNLPIHHYKQSHATTSTQMWNINAYIVNARETTCNWYLPDLADRAQYENCGSDVTTALALGDGLCQAIADATTPIPTTTIAPTTTTYDCEAANTLVCY